MLLAPSRLVLRALILGAGLAAVVLIWGMQQADAKPTPPLIDIGGGGIHIDVPPIGPIDVPPIDVGGAPPPAPGGTGAPGTAGSVPSSAAPVTPGPVDGVLPAIDAPASDVTGAAEQLGLTELVDDVTDAAASLVRPLAPIIDLVNHAVLEPLTDGIDNAVNQLIGPIVAVIPRASPSSAFSLPGPQSTAPAPAAPPEPGAPATQSLVTDAGRGPGTPGPPGGRAPPSPLGAPGPPLGTTGSTTSSNGNRLDVGILVLGLALTLLLAFRPRDRAWWYAGVYQLEPLTRPG